MMFGLENYSRKIKLFKLMMSINFIQIQNFSLDNLYYWSQLVKIALIKIDPVILFF